MSEGAVPVSPLTAPALEIVKYYLLWNYHSEGCRSGGGEAFRTVAHKSDEKNSMRFQQNCIFPKTISRFTIFLYTGD